MNVILISDVDPDETSFPIQHKFVNVSTIERHENTFFRDDDSIILYNCILNDIVLDSLHKTFKNKTHKIIALNVSVPKQLMDLLIYTSKLDIFDFIFINNTQDINKFKQYFHPDRVFYIPPVNPLNSTIKCNNNGSRDLLKQMSEERHKGKKIVYVPQSPAPWFNSVLYFLKASACFTISELPPTMYKCVDFIIPTTIQCCIMAIYQKVPIFPIFTERVILNFLLDIHWMHGYMTSEQDPDFSFDILCSRLQLFIKLHKDNVIHQKLTNIQAFLNTWNTWGINKVTAILQSKYDKRKLRLNGPPAKIMINNKIHKLDNTINYYIAKHGWNDIHTIAKIISFHLTKGNPYSKYLDGIQNKLRVKGDGYLKEAVDDWKTIIIKERESLGSFNNPNGLFNLTYIDQKDYSGVHRSGWQYVYDHLLPLHNSASPVLLDLYLDRTFGWEADLYKSLGIIPYKQYWYGFIHHTFDTSFSPNNCWKLLESKDFLQSLQYCKGIIVLSKYLQTQLQWELGKLGVYNIRVHYLCHPTQTHIPPFRMSNWNANSHKSIVQIGGWLRNTWSFYEVPLPTTIPISKKRSYSLRKVLLKGKGMDNYHAKSTFLPALQNVLLDDAQNQTFFFSNASTGTITNNWNKQFYSSISSKINGVKVVDHLGDLAYDELLSKNIVFINLVDASAVNTLIECIVRNTPIVVNNHPAVVELLGPKYPLLFQNLHDVYHLLTHKNIKKAHLYLKGLKKGKFEMEFFIEELTNLFSRQ